MIARIMRRFFLGLSRVVAAFFLFIIILGTLMLGGKKEKVDYPPPNYFPVLILMSGTEAGRFEPRIIYYKNLSSYQQKFKELTFLVPPHLEKELNQRLDILCQETHRLYLEDYHKHPEDCFSCGFIVQKQNSNRQSLKVSYMWDDDRPNTGWYEATDKEIFPRYHETFFGPGTLIGRFPLAIFLTILFWQLLTRGYRRWKTQRNNVVAATGGES